MTTFFRNLLWEFHQDVSPRPSCRNRLLEQECFLHVHWLSQGAMNLSLDNPYGEVTIPRAKLRTTADSSTVIANPLAHDSSLYSGRNSALNPYGNFKPAGEDSLQTVPESRDGSVQNPPPYEDQMAGYTVKEEEEEVGRCYSCCRRCRKK
ncbi:hypothetical protein AGOR_G00012550 [Albula goreensis]|uniref:Uncharacterized protein n=1 Tax=Albula goreensis TaxID=1534307 RepID=A0A8T3E870_9TELE|nr:hypothetical protein AGOR_G00012550 [Albula goreensis]